MGAIVVGSGSWNPVVAGGAPALAVAPSLTGVPQVGVTMTGDNGSWSGSPTGYAYKWQRSDNGTTGWTDIAGATSASYTVQAGDATRYLRRGVLASNASGPAAAGYAFSDASSQVSVASSASTYFDSLYAGGFTLDSGTDAKTLPTQTKPAKSTDILTGGYTDQRFGTAIRRVTAVADAVGGTATHQRHEYSRRQAFNADSTLFLAQSSQGWWFLYDANTCQVIPSGITSGPGQGGILGLAGDCEPIWHPTDPLKIWHTAPPSLVWQERTISRAGGTPTATTLFDLTSKLAALGAPWSSATAAWFNGEGRPSHDGRWWGLAIEGAGFSSIGAIMYDRQTDTITGSIQTGGNRPNWIGTSPLGNWVVMSWYGSAAANLAAEAARPMSSRAGVWAYSRDFSQFKVLSVLGEHSDMAVDAAGRECYVWISYRGFAEGGATDGLLCRQIAEDVVFNLPGPAYSSGGGNAFHISGCASARPGWVVVGRYIEIGNGPYDGQVYVLELKQTGARAYRLAHTRASIYNYFAEPHPTPNRDLTRVLFASDFGSGATPFEDYCICLPSWAIPAS